MSKEGTVVSLAVQADPITELTAKLWGQIIEQMNYVLAADKYYGFTHFDMFADPSIDQILQAVKVVEAILSAVLNSEHFEGDPERTMKLLNCQQAIYLIKRTNVSLKSGNQEEYQDCIKKLSAQRQY